MISDDSNDTPNAIEADMFEPDTETTLTNNNTNESTLSTALSSETIDTLPTPTTTDITSTINDNDDISTPITPTNNNTEYNIYNDSYSLAILEIRKMVNFVTPEDK
eukprot:CAMPEP_0114671612 /NCGR_PEP_ID=MMETSP0191-20121206/41439_1 /TAXON_ID=126664 /ORGANISM="Sorites sp." /LENGTH=105 /DNA_ID=CAMNT_0001931843 /DNA_START=562 /DNA_END=876 /DNA_ORIENTATION=+